VRACVINPELKFDSVRSSSKTISFEVERITSFLLRKCRSIIIMSTDRVWIVSYSVHTEIEIVQTEVRVNINVIADIPSFT